MVALWFLGGGAVGSLAVVLIAWTVRRLQPGRPKEAVTIVVGGALLRWMVAAGLLLLAWRQGVLPGILALAGLWVGRWGAIYWLDQRPRRPIPGRAWISGDLTHD